MLLFGLSIVLACLASMAVHLAWLSVRKEDGPIPSDEAVKERVWWGLYVNADDPRAWLPKPAGFGWTVNFRTHGHGLFFLMNVTGALVGAVILTMAALWPPGP